MARTNRYELDPFERPPRHLSASEDEPTSSWDDDEEDDWDEDDSESEDLEGRAWDDSDDLESWENPGQYGTRY